MLEPTIVTWILAIVEIVTCGPLLYAQLVMMCSPDSDRARELMIGKGEQWRDNSHFKSALGLARADWLIFVPVLFGGIVGMIMAQTWGYILFALAGGIQLYINVFLSFYEKDYVYPAHGPLAYYTYYWGNFVYFGAATVAYSILRLSGVSF